MGIDGKNARNAIFPHSLPLYTQDTFLVTMVTGCNIDPIGIPRHGD
jgi:hypothetical protein